MKEANLLEYGEDTRDYSRRCRTKGLIQPGCGNLLFFFEVAAGRPGFHCSYTRNDGNSQALREVKYPS